MGAMTIQGVSLAVYLTQFDGRFLLGMNRARAKTGPPIS
jgi:hypothetical protein